MCRQGLSETDSNAANTTAVWAKFSPILCLASPHLYTLLHCMRCGLSAHHHLIILTHYARRCASAICRWTDQRHWCAVRPERQADRQRLPGEGMRWGGITRTPAKPGNEARKLTVSLCSFTSMQLLLICIQNCAWGSRGHRGMVALARATLMFLLSPAFRRTLSHTPPTGCCRLRAAHRRGVRQPVGRFHRDHLR